MNQRSSILQLFLAATTFALVGCSSGGSAPSPAPTPTPAPSPPPASPSLQVVPANFDFGKVTEGNTPAPLEVTIRNTGPGPLRVSSIAWQAPANSSFLLDPSGGVKACASVQPTVAPNDFCTVHVAFSPSTTGTFNSTLQFNSNDGASPVFALPIAATREVATAWTVRINQIDALTCPLATAYVSVTDQGGFPVSGLSAANFVVSHGGGNALITSVSTVEGVAYPVAIAAVLDHSGSLTNQPVAFADMKSGFAAFFGGLRSGDSGAIINFDSMIEMVQPWTTNKTLLQASALAPWDKGGDTKLYDAAFLAVEQAATQIGARRAVILATDGDDSGSTSPYSTASLSQVIASGSVKKVPIFTVGVGRSVNKSVLAEMANGTGGLFYEAATSQNLATIYQQLTTLLYGKQYVIVFSRATGATYNVVALGATPPMGVTVTRDSRPITACP